MAHHRLSLIATLNMLRTEHNPAALNYVAICTWSRGSKSARADLRVSMRMRATTHTVAGELRLAADERYLELLEWCIRTLEAPTSLT